MKNHIEIPTYLLSQAEQKQIIETIEQIPTYTAETFDQFRKSCKKANSLLPYDFRNWITENMKSNFLLIQNVPLDPQIPSTPIRKFEVDNLAMSSDKVLGLMSESLGNIYTFDGKATNRHIHNVYPALGEETSQLGYSQTELEWHVEDGFHEYRPHWVGLLCLRGDTSVITKISRCSDILSYMPIPTIAFEKRFALRIDDSFTSENHDNYILTQIFKEEENDFKIVFDPFYTKTTTAEEKEVLNLITSIAEKNHVSIALKKGDLLFFDNRRTIHSRTAYKSRMDGTDRWVKRVLVLDKKYSALLKNGYISINQ